MKKTYLAVVASALVAVPAALTAQPTITHLQDIVISGLEAVPTGICVTSDGTAYVAGAEQRRVVKATGVVTTSPGAPAIAVRTSDADTPAGPVNWALFRGLFTAAYNPSTNKVLIAGDQGTDGTALLIDPTDDSVVYQAANIPEGGNPGPRRVAGAEFYGTDIIAQFTAGTNYWQFNTALDALSGPGFYSGPTPSASRDLAVTSGGDVLVSYNNKFVGDGLTAGIHRISDDATNPLSLTGNTNTSDWYVTTVSNSGSIQGVSTFTYLGNSTEYVVLCLPESDEIRIIDLATATLVTTLTDATNLTFPRDAVVVTVGSSQYLVVSNSDDGSANGRISVFGIDGAALQTGGPSTAEGWELYN